jgi:Ran GTPase-activating protein (RanGAP) involved in mRNA processing and transport
VVLQGVVARCPELKHLDLSLNALGYNLVKRTSNTPPPSICDLLFTTSIETLDLSCLHLSDTHIDVLLESPSLTLSIRRLYLRSNDLSDAAAVAFANVIESHRLVALQVLSLAGNGIGDHGLGALAFVLDIATALETLDMDDNKVRLYT